MYKQYDRYAAIAEVQKYLSKINLNRRYIAINGIYDENTRLSVLDFQKANSLKESGEVDKITFEMIYREYRRITETEEIRDILRQNSSVNGFDFDIGDFSGGLNRILSEVMEYLRMHNDLRNTSYFNDASVKAIEELGYVLLPHQKSNALFYRRLIIELISIRRLKAEKTLPGV